MDEGGVKRSYRSAVRAGRAVATRAAIREAASQLFVRNGYVATTMKAVARAAGVGERTVYAVFPTKRDLYAQCLGVALVGDELPIAVADREEVKAAREDTDPRNALRRSLEYATDLLDRAGPLIFAGIEAAGADPDMRAMGEEGSAATLQEYRVLTRHLASMNALREGVDPTIAADILFTLGSPHVHRLLRHDRGWPSQRYREWLIATAEAQVLVPVGHGR